MRKKVKRKTILIDGIRYYDDKPDTCRKCFFWKNRKVGCVLGTQMYEGLLRDEIPQEHKDRIEMASELLRRSRILVVCGDSMDGQVKDDIGLAKRLRIAATTLDGIMNLCLQS